MEEKNENQKVLTPSEYFDHLKSGKETITNEKLKNSYSVFLTLAKKYQITGQTEALKKLCFLADTMKDEEKLIELGITTYVQRDKIEDFITNVDNDVVKIIELSRYTREVPDDIVEVVEKTKDIFDEFYVVFTDYTGKEERKVQAERREKDPILFGVFLNNNYISDRFYFLGDWVDEYCDLTLDKMIEKYTDLRGYSPVIEEKLPETVDELTELLSTFKKDMPKDKTLDEMEEDVFEEAFPKYTKELNITPKKHFFDKVRSIFKRK